MAAIKIPLIPERPHHPSKVDDVAFNNNELQGNESSCTFPVSIRPNDENWMTNEFLHFLDNKKRDAGIVYRSLNVYGFDTTTDYQKTFVNYPLSLLKALFGRIRKSRIDIFREIEGVVSSSQMLLILGKPGSGCTTLLKTLAGHNHGFYVDQSSVMNYQGRIIKSA